MQERIPQSVAKRIVFKAFLAADHVTAAGAALTIPVQISKNGGAFANLDTPANAISVGNGWYYIQLAIADTGTLGPLIVRGTEGTIDPVELICEVVAATNAGFTALPAVAAGAASGLPLKDANNFLNVANVPAIAAGSAGGLALVGSLMGLGNDAITAAKFDESTAFPVKSADTGITQIARVGADSDTLETLSDQIDEISVELSPEDLQAIIDGLVEGGVTDWTVEQRAAILAAIAAIQAKTNTIGTGRITYASTVGEAGLATIWAGDDYRAADGTAFAITRDDYAGPSLTTATAKLRIMDSVQYLSAVDGVSVAADLEVAATIAIDGDTITLAADLTAAQTAALATSPPQLAHNYVYEFVCTLANGHIGYRTHGRMTVKKAIAAGT